MTDYIPPSEFTSVSASVLGAVTSQLSQASLWLTSNTTVPYAETMSFSNYADVANYFGPTSVEAVNAQIYFNGFEGSNIKPTKLKFAQYNTAAVAGYLRSAKISDMTLTQLQALTGVLTITIDGTARTSGTINLSTATSFSNAATIIQTAFTGNFLTVTYNSQLGAFFFTSASTGVNSTMSFATGTLSTGLRLTMATGAGLSAGAAAAVTSTFMQMIVNSDQNWITFLTLWEPNTAGKLEFSLWANGDKNHVYIGWDTDMAVRNTADLTTSFGYIVDVTNKYDGTIAISGGVDKAAFVAGLIASVDYMQTRGWTSYAYKRQSGLTPEPLTATQYNNVKSNGYNVYCWTSLNADTWNFLQPGTISGQWSWADNYIDKIIMLNDIQAADLTLLTNVKALSADSAGIEILRASTEGAIQKHVNFGSIQQGIAISAAQAAIVNAAAGLKIDDVLSNQGYYLQIIPAGSTDRANRKQSRTLWYTSAQAIHTLQLAAINVQ